MKNNEHKPPSHSTVLDIDIAISKRSGRGGIMNDASSREIPSCPNNLNPSLHDTTKENEKSLRPFDANDGYEYLNHTADIQLHAYGEDLTGALENLALAMFNYMASLDGVEIDEEFSTVVASKIIAKGHDLQSMVFNFLDEWLFVFHSTYFIAKYIEIECIDLQK
jgi:SHS2 domain-containing protein